MGSGLLAALLAAAGYALLEAAFFADRNLLLPWEPRHLTLLPIFFVMHGVVAMAALGAARMVGRLVPALARTLPPLAPAAALLAVHAVTYYRERTGVLPRDLTGTVVTAAILLAFAAAAVAAAAALRRRPAAAARAGVLLGVLLIAAGLVRVATVRPQGVEAAVPPRPAEDRLHAADTGQRVLVFGFDGATWDVLDPMIAEGKLPNIAALAARGRTFDLETISPTFSPIIWTTVATGKDRFQHGIHDVVQTVLPGGVRLPRSMRRTAFCTKTTGVLFRALDRRRMLPLAPYRSGDVRATSVFEAASEAGLSTSLVEWYVTWPAVPLSGVTVSDRFHLRGTGPSMEGLVRPAALEEKLASDVVAPSAVPVDDVLALCDLEGLSPDARDAWAARHETFVREIRLNLARDRTTRNVAVDLLARDQGWRLFGVYFRAVDLSHHLTWKYWRAASGGPSADEEETAAMQTVVRRYHELMDAIVGDVLALVPEDATVLLLSDHGFEDVYDHRRGPDGFAVLAGGPVRPSPQRGRLSVYDVAPTLAALLGVPVAEDLAAEPRTDLLDPAFVVAHPPSHVTTWERTGAAGGDDAPVGAVDAEEVERLRALGYIE